MRGASLGRVFELIVQFVLAPLLVLAASLAARRWGHGIGGLVSAFPAIVGPVLLIGAHRHGTSFAAEQATGTLLGLTALSGFALAYGRTALHVSWPVSVAAGWAIAAATAGLAGAVGANLLGAAVAAVVSLALAHRGLPRLARGPAVEAPGGDLALRMALTVVLVVSLAALAGWLGPTAGGIVTALPVLACILAAFTHEHFGGAAVAQLLRGMLSGMAGFVVFCLLVAAIVNDAGVAITFLAATSAALCTQAAIARASMRAGGRVARPASRPTSPGRAQPPTRMSFLLTNSSAPKRPSSRPKPEALTPPNGSSTPSAPTALMKTMPASIWSATRSACSGSVCRRRSRARTACRWRGGRPRPRSRPCRPARRARRTPRGRRGCPA